MSCSPEGGRVVVADVTDEVLSGADLLRRVGRESDGAVILFEGRVRDHNGGRSVTCLHYEAYRGMADRVLHEIATEAVRATGASAVAVRHRIGSLKPPSVSLVVVVAAPHRRPAYEASSYVIEELKKRLPLWKREEYSDGTSRWLGGQRPPSAAALDPVEASGA